MLLIAGCARKEVRIATDEGTLVLQPLVDNAIRVRLEPADYKPLRGESRHAQVQRHQERRDCRSAYGQDVRPLRERRPDLLRCRWQRSPPGGGPQPRQSHGPGRAHLCRHLAARLPRGRVPLRAVRPVQQGLRPALEQLRPDGLQSGGPVRRAGCSRRGRRGPDGERHRHRRQPAGAPLLPVLRRQHRHPRGRNLFPPAGRRPEDVTPALPRHRRGAHRGRFQHLAAAHHFRPGQPDCRNARDCRRGRPHRHAGPLLEEGRGCNHLPLPRRRCAGLHGVRRPGRRRDRRLPYPDRAGARDAGLDVRLHPLPRALPLIGGDHRQRP